MGFVERIFHPVIQAVERAFTPPGTGGQEAAAQQSAAAQTAALPPQPIPPTAPAAPKAPPQFSPGASPGSASSLSKKTATTMLGAAAAGSELAKASATPGQKNQKLG